MLIKGALRELFNFFLNPNSCSTKIAYDEGSKPILLNCTTISRRAMIYCKKYGSSFHFWGSQCCGGSTGRVRGSDPPPPKTLSDLTKEIKGSYMTINWLIFKNETCVELCPSTKYKTCSNLYFFCDNPLMTPLMVGSASKSVVPDDWWRRLSLWPHSFNRLKSNSRKGWSYRMWCTMHDAELTWGRRY